MSGLFRLACAALAGLVLTGGMFWGLHALVTRQAGVSELKRPARIEFSRSRRDTAVESRRQEKAKLEMSAALPSTPTAMSSSKGDSGGIAVSIAPVKMAAGDVSSSVGVKKLMVKAGGSDRDVVPLVRIEPEYPVRAAERGIEGWVVVRFTITPVGTVRDAVVVDSSPKKVFDDAAVAAVLRWKYNPKIEEGVAVERRGVQVLLRFDLTKE